MKIRNWEHAIDLTIERHQAVLDGKYDNYVEAKDEMNPPDWICKCPLCEYVPTDDCCNCLWIKYEGTRCLAAEYRFNNKQSIKRLENWKTELNKQTK